MIDIQTCNSFSDIARKLGLATSGNNLKIARKYAEDNNLDMSHFRRGKEREKYKKEEVPCPICGKIFTLRVGAPRNNTTCSSSCANTHFRSGSDHPNWKEARDLLGKDAYRRVCFANHEKKCIICGEENIVAVHHYDEDHNNNLPENLVPMCPTHHQYVHSSFKHLVQEKIDTYISWFKRK